MNECLLWVQFGWLKTRQEIVLCVHMCISVCICMHLCMLVAIGTRSAVTAMYAVAGSVVQKVYFLTDCVLSHFILSHD